MFWLMKQSQEEAAALPHIAQLPIPTDPSPKSQLLYSPQLQKNPFCNWYKQLLAGISPQTHWNNWEINPQLHSATFQLKISFLFGFGMSQGGFLGWWREVWLFSNQKNWK